VCEKKGNIKIKKPEEISSGFLTGRWRREKVHSGQNIFFLKI
jgi:hypothetical protein